MNSKETVETVPGKYENPKRSSGLMTSIFNLTKSAIGMGMLSIPSAYKGTGLITGILLTIFAMWMGCFSLHFIRRVGEAKQVTRFPDLGKAVFGRPGEILITTLIFILLLCPLTGYIMILGQYISNVLLVFAPHLAPSGSKALPFYLHPRFFSAVATYVFIQPLCYLRNMHALGKFSLLALGCMFYVAILVIFDFMLAVGSHEGRAALATVSYFSTDIASCMISFCVIIMAFMSQTSSLQVFGELVQPTPKRVNYVILASNMFSFIAYFMCGLFGYLRFGSAVDSNILKNSSSFPYVLGKLLVGFSLAFGVPLVMFPTRDCAEWILDQSLSKTSWGKLSSNQKFNYLTFFIIAASVPLSFVFEDLQKLLSLFGSVCASNVVFVFPSLCMLKVGPHIGMSRLERVSSWLVLVVGVLMFFIGTTTSVLDLFKKD